MINKNIFFKFLLLLFMVVGFSGCVKKNNDKLNTGLMPTIESTQKSALEDKNREIIMTGIIKKLGNLYVISMASGKTQDLESYTIEFDKYLGKTVTVTGEYSGDTLFVTKITN